MQQANINDCVWVRLTPAAEAVWADYWKLSHPDGVPDAVRHTDIEGRTKFQLHELMLIFGQQMWMGNPRAMFKENKIWHE